MTIGEAARVDAEPAFGKNGREEGGTDSRFARKSTSSKKLANGKKEKRGWDFQELGRKVRREGQTRATRKTRNRRERRGAFEKSGHILNKKGTLLPRGQLRCNYKVRRGLSRKRVRNKGNLTSPESKRREILYQNPPIQPQSAPERRCRSFGSNSKAQKETRRLRTEGPRRKMISRLHKRLISLGRHATVGEGGGQSNPGALGSKKSQHKLRKNIKPGKESQGRHPFIQ